jgi:inner membrane protein
MLPDIDSLGFFMGIPYGSFWGHRGFTHSLLFALIIALPCAVWLRGKFRSSWKFASLFFLAIASHGLLDAMTNGGLGVAFFSPFDLHRYFLPWRPILVSPIGVTRFLSTRGLRILVSEVIYVWCPALVLVGLASLCQIYNKHRLKAFPLSNAQK